MPIFNYQYTLDELSGLDRTQSNSFADVIEKGVKAHDTHPALVQILIYYLSKLFGYAAWVIKLPFLLFSFGAIIYAYFFGYTNFSKKVGIIASLFFSFSLVFVYYAPIARMYISGIFFSIALLFYFFEIVYSNKTKLINYFLFGLFALLSALNQHINALFAFTVCVSGLFYLTKNNAKFFLITCAMVVLAYLPHLPVTLYQLSFGGIGYNQGGWLEVPNVTKVFNFIKVIFGTGKSYLVFLILCIATAILNKQLLFTKKQTYLASIFLINLAIVYFYSVFRAPVFQNSVMLFSTVAFVILISTLLEAKNNFIFTISAIIITTLFFYKTYYKKNYYNECVSNIFEYQFKRTAELKNKYGNLAVYPIYFDCDTFMKKIYFKKHNTKFDCKIAADSVTFSLLKFSQFISNLKSNYLVLASSFPNYQAVAKEYFPYLIENTQTQGLNFKVYSKLKNYQTKCVSDDEILNYASVTNVGNYEFSNPDNLVNYPNHFLYSIKSTNEFPFQANAILNKVTSKEGQFVLVTAKIKANNFNLNNVELCIAIKETKRDSSVSYTAYESANFLIKNDTTLSMYSGLYCGTNYNAVKNDSKLSTYIWNRGKQNFTLTNFEIETINFWPQKWNFWE